MKILIVDDKEESRYLLECLLKGNDCDVAVAVNGSQAFEKLQTEAFDLVISDILMPVMDGFQLCRKIKNDKKMCHIPIIIYTATYTGPQDEEFAMKIGANRFIRKPCEPDDFMEAVRGLMKQAREVKTSPTGEPTQEEILKLYSERLVRKLEQKMLEAEKEVCARKEAEEELRISNTRLRMALAASNIGLWDWNLETNEVWFSPEWKRQIGYEEHELTNRYEEWETRIHPEDRSAVLAELNKYLEGHSAQFSVEFRLRHKNGSYRWITARGAKVPEPSGESQQMTGCHVDITPHKEAIQALDGERKKFQFLVDESPLGFALVGKDERFRYLNPRFVELFGYNLEDIPSRQIWLEKAYPEPRYRQEITFLWQHAKSTNDPGVFSMSSPLNLTCKDGKEKKVQIRIAFLATGEQVATYEDVSAQVRFEEKLRQAQKSEAIATLAGGIAHDFNNILSAIIGYSELIQYSLTPGSEIADNIKEVLTAGLRAKDLTRHILAFSRQIEHERIPLAPHLIVKEALSLLQATLPSNIEIRQDAAPVGNILGDPTQIHQVIMNLGTNAYHAMRERGGVLEVSVRKMTLEPEEKDKQPDLVPGNYIRLSVSDTGVGMAPEVISKIFDPYYTTKTEGEGTGLGLAVTYGIVKSHQGTINVYSEPGKGSIFHVYFPLIERAAGAEEEVGKAILPTGTERILFVDDEISLANLGKQLIESLGYKVVTRTSAREALELFRNKPEMFDLVITDMAMPGMTGAEFATELLRLRPNTPIILCTGFSYSMTEETAKTIGIREFVMKPFVQRDVATIIRKVLDHK